MTVADSDNFVDYAHCSHAYIHRHAHTHTHTHTHTHSAAMTFHTLNFPVQIHIVVGIGDLATGTKIPFKDAGPFAFVSFSPNDPIFPNHHTMVDCLFEQWLQRYKDSVTYDSPLIRDDHRAGTCSRWQRTLAIHVLSFMPSIITVPTTIFRTLPLTSSNWILFSTFV